MPFLSISVEFTLVEATWHRCCGYDSSTGHHTCDPGDNNGAIGWVGWYSYTLRNLAAFWVLGVSHKSTLCGDTSVCGASVITAVISRLGIFTDTGLTAAIKPFLSLCVWNTIVNTHIFNLGFHCYCSGRYWCEGGEQARSGWGHWCWGRGVKAFWNLAAWVFRVYNQSAVVWNIQVCWTSFFASVSSNVHVNTFTQKLTAIFPFLALSISNAMVEACTSISTYSNTSDDSRHGCGYRVWCGGHGRCRGREQVGGIGQSWSRGGLHTWCIGIAR